MSAELDALTAQVTRMTNVSASAVTLITGIAARIEAAKSSPVQVQALADELRTDADRLSAAVVANTP